MLIRGSKTSSDRQQTIHIFQKVVSRPLPSVSIVLAHKTAAVASADMVSLAHDAYPRVV